MRLSWFDEDSTPFSGERKDPLPAEQGIPVVEAGPPIVCSSDGWRARRSTMPSMPVVTGASGAAEATALPRPKWVLDGDAFHRLLASLDPDPARAALKYEVLRKKLVMLFLGRGSREAEDNADETLDRVSRRIAEGEVLDDVTRFAHGVARRVHSECLRRERRQRRARQALVAAPRPAPSPVDSEPGIECIRLCIDRLPSADRTLIVEYYDESGRALQAQRRESAARLGISPSTLRLRAFRIRRSLEDCTRDCMLCGGRPVLPTPGERPR